MGRRVLVLGATSYVAQFVLHRYLTGSSDGANPDTVSEMACTVRGHPQASELPEGLELAAAVPVDKPKGSSRRVLVYPGVTFADVNSVRACVEAFHPDVVLNCIGGLSVRVFVVDEWPC